jgi:hypothetical protein
MKRYVTLGDGRTIGLARYCAAWKQCLELPANTPIGRGINGWGQTAGEALRDLRRGLEDRINSHIPGYGVGRKWSSDWYFATWNASRQINNPRLIVRWLPADMMKVPRFRDRVEYGRSI